MNRVVHILLLILAGLIVLVMVAMIAVVVTARRPFPDTDSTIQLESAQSGLQEEVTIYRDDLGIPHIYANNQNDLFFAQGYVTAQDRFWQMEWWRHQSQGRLSEIVGEPTVEIDKYLRNTGFNRAAEHHLAYYEAEEPEVMAMIEAYAAGVNAWLGENEGDISINQTILNLNGSEWEIEPWEPLDTVSWAVAMAYSLRGSGNMENEMNRMLLEETLGEEMVAELLPFYPYDARPVIAPTSLHIGANNGSGEDTAVTHPNVNQLTTNLIGQPPSNWFALGIGSDVGSNSWVVGGELTDTGLPLLANDPHLGIQMPSIWYEVGLHAPGWNVVGFSLPSFPGVVIGHNENIAWGFTNVGGDVQDLYIERINPDNRLQYEYMGEWRDMEVIEEVIKVNGGDDVILEVRQTHHGPIINNVDEGIDEVLSLRWTVAEVSHVFKAVIGFNTAENFEEFRAAARYFDVPPQNLIYADREGNIGYQTPGLYPIRQNHDGLRPMPGWTDEFEWDGFIPFEEMPAMYNPESGIIITANNAVTDEEFPYDIAKYWDNGDRAQRITDMINETLAQNGVLTAEDFAVMQFDSYSMLAETYVPLLVTLSSDDPEVQAALNLLAEWDYQERRDSVAASIFEMFHVHLLRAILADDVAAVDEIFPWYADPQRVFLHDVADQPDAVWWDDSTTAAVETREAILLQALTEGIGWLQENVGDDMDAWTWGTIHTSTFQSLPLGDSGIGPVEGLVNRGPFATDGGTDIVNATSWDPENPAAVTWLPSMRMIVDLSDFDASQTIHTTGQSGHPSNPHYDDMIPLWLNGEYHPMLWGDTAVQENAVDVMTLQP